MWGRRSKYLRLWLTSASVCVLLAALALERLFRGQPLPQKALELGPMLFLVFAGLAALNFYRWRHEGEDL